MEMAPASMSKKTKDTMVVSGLNSSQVSRVIG